MSELKQLPSSITFYKGWYGKCGSDECQPYDLSDIKSKLEYVYQTSSLTDGYVVYNASLPDRFNIFTKLQCGRSYIIILQPGSDTISIPHFTHSSHGEKDYGRLAADCAPVPSQTPSVTTTPSITPTITVSVTPGLSPSTTPTVTPTKPQFCTNFKYTLPGEHPLAVGGIRTQGIHKNAIVCHNGTSGGTGWNTLLRLQPSMEFVGVLVINGAMNWGNIQYKHFDGTEWSGEITTGASITNLNKS